jgi:Rrf2 family nitric oxide-sensitive transcriptional repressor
MKVTHQLGLGGWLETVRGKGGGMRLAAAPATSTRAVVRSVEPDFFLVDCLGNDAACVLTGRCRLTAIVSGALQSFMQHLDGHTLADLLPATAKVAAKPKSVRTRPVTFSKRLPVAAS